MLSQCFINELDIYLYMDYDMKVLIERRINMPIGKYLQMIIILTGYKIKTKTERVILGRSFSESVTV